MKAPPAQDLNLELYLQRYQDIAEGNRHFLSALENLWNTFDQSGIPILPLKGMDLILRAYPPLGQRPMFDIDLLIQPHDVPEVRRLLEQARYVPVGPHHWLTHSLAEESMDYCSADHSVSLDVSWNIWYMPDDHILWNRRVSRSTLFGQRLLLHPHDAFLFLIAYAVMHRGHLTSLFAQDVRMWIEKEGNNINWLAWCQEVNALGLQVPVYYGLHYAEEQGVKVPADVLNALLPQSVGQRAVHMFYARMVTDQTPPVIRYLQPLIGIPGWKGKFKLLRRVLFPSKMLLERRVGRFIRTDLYVMTLLFRPLRLSVRGAYFIGRDIMRLVKPLAGPSFSKTK